MFFGLAYLSGIDRPPAEQLDEPLRHQQAPTGVYRLYALQLHYM